MDEVQFEQAMKFAIVKEEEAAKLYARMANVAADVQAKSFLLEMSREEEKHRQMLEELQARGHAERISFAQPLDLKIVEYLQPAQLDPNMSYRDALLYAANREKEAAAYYQHMAGIVADETAKELFAGLAKWELSHKLRVEEEYERHFMPEN